MRESVATATRRGVGAWRSRRASRSASGSCSSVQPLRPVARRSAVASTSRGCRSATCAPRSSTTARRRSTTCCSTSGPACSGRRLAVRSLSARARRRRAGRAAGSRRAGSFGTTAAWLTVVVIVDESVRDPLRDRGAHVHARDAARRVRHPRSPARARAADARPARASSPSITCAARLHAVLGVLPRRRRRRRRCSSSRGATRRRAAAALLVVGRDRRRPADVRAVAARRSSRSARTPARRGAIPCCPGFRSARRSSASRAARSKRAGCSCSCCVPLLLLGVFARGVDGRHLELDLRVQPSARWLAFVGGATLVVGVSSTTSPGRRSSRAYSAIVFPFFALLVGRGLVDARRHAGPHGRGRRVIVVLGLRRRRAQRDRAAHAGRRGGERARAEAQPGDLVVYCPDQLGPAVHRLLPGGLDEVTYPELRDRPRSSTGSTTRSGSTRPTRRRSRTRSSSAAGPGTIWLVTGPGYPNHHGACEAVSARARGARRARRARDRRTRTTSRSPACNSSRRRHSEDGRGDADRLVRSGRVRDAARAVLVPFVLSRVLVIAALGLTARSSRDLPTITDPIQVGQGLRAWDAAFYADIARGGYDAVAHDGLRFFPLFPLLAACVALLPGRRRGSGARCSSRTHPRSRSASCSTALRGSNGATSVRAASGVARVPRCRPRSCS